MDDSKLLSQIGELLDSKLKPVEEQLDGLEGKLGTVEKQLETVELKVEAVNKKVDYVHQDLSQKIEQSQQETIEVLSDLIHTGYEIHEKRIKKLEVQLIPQ